MEGDKSNKFLADEMGLMPLVFEMGGSKFRLDMLKMAFANQPSYPKPTIDSLIKDAEKLCDWVNNKSSFPPLQNQPKND